MLILVLIAALVGLMILPQFLVRRRMKHYHRIDQTLDGTGGELAEHLIKRFQLPVSITDQEGGDFYDPARALVSLSPENRQKRSITAVAVAAHEVAHAMQHHKRWRPFMLRQRMAPVIALIQYLVAMLTSFGTALIFIPGLGIIWRLLIISLIISGLLRILFHLMTLPVELHASYKLALPLLSEYIPEEKLPAARKVLRAAAMTYVASAMADFVNLGIWLRLLRR